jgi:hypothetical protein
LFDSLVNELEDVVETEGDVVEEDDGGVGGVIEVGILAQGFEG